MNWSTTSNIPSLGSSTETTEIISANLAEDHGSCPGSESITQLEVTWKCLHEVVHDVEKTPNHNDDLTLIRDMRRVKMEIIHHSTTVFAQQFRQLRLIRAKSRRTPKEDLRSCQHCQAPSRGNRGRKTPNLFKNRTWFFTDVTLHAWSRIVTSDWPTQNRSTHTVGLIPNVTEHKSVHFITPTELRNCHHTDRVATVFISSHRQSCDQTLRCLHHRAFQHNCAADGKTLPESELFLLQCVRERTTKQPNTFAFNCKMTTDLKPSFPIWSSRMTLRKPPRRTPV